MSESVDDTSAVDGCGFVIAFGDVAQACGEQDDVDANAPVAGENDGRHCPVSFAEPVDE